MKGLRGCRDSHQKAAAHAGVKVRAAATQHSGKHALLDGDRREFEIIALKKRRKEPA